MAEQKTWTTSRDSRPKETTIIVPSEHTAHIPRSLESSTYFGAMAGSAVLFFAVRGNNQSIKSFLSDERTPTADALPALVKPDHDEHLLQRTDLLAIPTEPLNRISGEDNLAAGPWRSESSAWLPRGGTRRFAIPVTGSASFYPSDTLRFNSKGFSYGESVVDGCDPKVREASILPRSQRPANMREPRLWLPDPRGTHAASSENIFAHGRDTISPKVHFEISVTDEHILMRSHEHAVRLLRLERCQEEAGDGTRNYLQTVGDVDRSHLLAA